jgi:cytoskeletal protein CcmA (bactofilin family)
MTDLLKGIGMADINPTNNNLVIGEGVTFKGSISAPGKAVINGNVSGELTADDLLIGTKGQVTGSVRAREIDVHGELNEDIVCKEHLLIHSTGKVSGTLEYHELEIQRGGKFKGNMNQK